jgi:hypothetical protein
MPTSQQHAARIKEGLDNVAFLVSNPDVLARVALVITEYFYVSLHMFEATLYEFPQD